ncbi:uncharacterized protein PRCAT00003494001 [Priceomyces carsonii]|uniref:uncharacterized protein n=1 Tax=Priceomyces carsonii TaxID=28549 RepID=UPI002EDB6A99|nr:unnamed protein product [Priceomyces carsonii]
MGASKLEFLKDIYINVLKSPNPRFLPQDYPDLSGKNVIITGASSGLGLEVLRLLLIQHANIGVVVRNVGKMEAAIENLKKNCKNIEPSEIDLRVHIFEADLSDLSSIHDCAVSIVSAFPELHFVFQNAGIMMPPKGSKSAQGFELQWSTNVLAPYLLQKYLTPCMLKVSQKNPNFIPRVIWVSSNAYLSGPGAVGIDFDTIKLKNPPNYSPMAIYGQSKVGVNFVNYMFAQKYKGKIISTALHPGILKTGLQKDFPFIERFIVNHAGRDASYGAYTEMYAALSSEVTKENSGCFIGPQCEIQDYVNFFKEGTSNGMAEKIVSRIDEQVAPYFKA